MSQVNSAATSRLGTTGRPDADGFSPSFYLANAMEIFERLAWYGFFTLSSLYMSTPLAEGGLGFSEGQRGFLQGAIPFLLYLLPVFTGALGDKVGYRRMFLLAFIIMTPGYYLLGQVRDFWSFFAVLLAVAVGAAIFKPLVVATVSRTTNDQNRGLGFGIFYTMVNIGGFVGPLVAGVVRGVSWDRVFTMAALWVGINFVLLLFYREPRHNAAAPARRHSPLREIATVLRNRPFVIYLLLMSGFWACYNQIFITLPLYIRDFVDTAPLLSWLQSWSPAIADAVSSASPGQVGPEFITAFNFASILILQIVISKRCQGRPVLPLLIGGSLLLSVSFLWIGFGPVLGGAGVIVAVLLFSLGEMIASPKSQEYVAEVMPRDRAAMFMGYYFLSMALGFLLAGFLSGWGYGTLAKDWGRPDLMWGGFALAGVVAAAGLYWFDKKMARQLAAREEVLP
ncbi:Dipeptide/tripeptide permease [Microbulbifer donghaiensis]|uniref:Dipeptide/tripeptide permease n=1 Tax=Microbulbifer donghaiensis TaxID=494016 RepID=A0A1M4UDP8_9GAMM|nr:MFS transporter [Microbulbifer donghaiensis]SHE54748.1 Dipeptide/tripeptide permease [Microbulbifer donghaiensis]